MGGTTHYVPWDYQRVCDICGVVRNRSTMIQRPGSVFICPRHRNERTELELSELNANIEPYKILPAPDPKPQNYDSPNTYRADDAAIFNFLLSRSARYRNVTNGMGADLTPGYRLQTWGWAARYFYDLIQQNTANPIMLAQARTQLASIADSLRAIQLGGPSFAAFTRANSAFYGAFIDTQQATIEYVTVDQAICGLALLYAYRVLGTPSYLASAVASASFLRNIQAIGAHGTNFTSKDSAGTVRLYTGALTSFVPNVNGLYSDHRFYPSCLVALDFWSQLKTTAGDVDVGASSAVLGFDSVPDCLLSEAISDLRSFWSTGVANAGSSAVVNGFSSSTPFECFNAYPQTKPNTTVTGTGTWEYQDGISLVTGLNWAQGLGALYAYEGASTQVTSILSYLRGFDSNSSYETPANTPTSVLAAGSTGEYNATQGIATLLQVAGTGSPRNGSSLYDWGAFGCVARLWNARHAADFKAARLNVIGVTQRFDNGTRSDGDQYDRIALRGRSGLTFQTSFTESVLGGTYRVKDAQAAAQWGVAYRL